MTGEEFEEELRAEIQKNWPRVNRGSVEFLRLLRAAYIGALIEGKRLLRELSK